jgi:hypothetical protein
LHLLPHRRTLTAALLGRVGQDELSHYVDDPPKEND